MIISESEIRKCIDNIDASGQHKKPGHLLLSRSDRARVDAYKSSMEKIPARINAHLSGVKKAFDSRVYSVSGSEVAEKMLGRVISDKLR